MGSGTEVIGVIDVETTGLDSVNGGVCEIACVVIQNGEQISSNNCLVNPGKPIPVVASAVHHLTDKDVVDARSLDEAIKYVVPGGIDVLAAHNAPFDRGFLPSLHDYPWIDTCACARHLYPDCPTYGNQVLRYYLGVEPRSSFLGREGLPHSAGFDAQTTAEILMLMLKTHSVEELLELSGRPVLMKSMPFGKHRGVKFEDVPKDYLTWLASKNDISDDLRFTLEHHLD